MLVTKEGEIPNILVVDDEPSIRMVLNILLSAESCKVYEAGNAQEALEILGEDQRIDVALVDNRLPGGMSGLELRKKIMDRVPVFMISAADDLLGVPKDDILRKPFDKIDDIVMAVGSRICPPSQA